MSSSKILSCGMLFIMCLISASMAQDELQDMRPPKDQEELLKNVQGLLRSIQSMLDPGYKTVSENAKSNWTCSGVSCRRCQQVRFSSIGFDQYCCVTIVYLKSSNRLRTSVTFGTNSFSKEVSLSEKNPDPICKGIPNIKTGASICLKLSNVHKHGSKSVHGYASLIGRGYSVQVGEVNLGEFDIYYANQAAAKPKSAMPDFEDDMVMMENIGQPL